MNFDLRQVPFSRFGSYFAFSIMEGRGADGKGLYLRTVRGDAREKEIFLIETVYDGKTVPYTIKAVPELLKLETSYGDIDICISEASAIRVRGKGAGIRLSTGRPGAFGLVMQGESNTWQYNSTSINFKLLLNPHRGSCSVDAPWEGIECRRISADFLPEKNSTEFECIIEEFESSWKSTPNIGEFDNCVNKVRDEFGTWLEKTLPVPGEFDAARELAAYINWSSAVGVFGNFSRPSMLMSKNWMTNVWSWDHCFNAMGLLKDIDMAWDQIMTVFDHQDYYGALPDTINNANKSFCFCKPPIHGWALNWLMENSGKITEEHLQEVYEPLCKWTKWWFCYRDTDGDGIPEYNHGNDSGWDNSTVFKEGIPIESPDLCAFLVIQTETLSKIASILNKPEEQREWERQSKNLLERLIKEFWIGQKFAARHTKSHEKIESDSLLTYIPIILGKRLPENILSSMITDLKKEGRFLTAFGFATESVDSPLYQADGYWRGPIWAPSTMIIIDGLLQAGETEFAKQIARRFCEMAAKSGMAENFDAISGESLRDKAYTWTSSVFLILAGRYI